MNDRILIVHTAVVMRMIVRDALISSGYDVVGEAESGSQAVEKYRALSPDLVTMDMILPEIGGVGAVTAIIAEFPQAKIVMCTSTGQPALLAEAMQAGAKAFITKPFGPMQLIDVIKGALA